MDAHAYQGLSSSLLQLWTGNLSQVSRDNVAALFTNPTPPSPLDLALATGAGLDTIKTLYQENTDALTLKTLFLACDFASAYDPPRLDNLMYLVGQKPELISQTLGGQPHNYVLYHVMGMGWMETQFDSKEDHYIWMASVEKTIKELIELWPDSVVTPMGPKKNTPLQLRRGCGLSNELMEFMIRKIPESIPSFCLEAYEGNIRWSVFSPFPILYLLPDDLHWIGVVLAKVTGIFECRFGREEWARLQFREEWAFLQEQGQLDFLRMILLENNHIPNLDLSLDDSICSNLPVADGPNPFAPLLAHVPTYQGASQIQCITLRIAAETGTEALVHFGLMGCLVHMENLKTLQILIKGPMSEQDTGFGPAAESLAQLIRLGTLQSLKIKAESLKTPRPRYGGGNPPPVVAMIEALKDNTNMVEFVVEGLPRREFLECADPDDYDSDDVYGLPLMKTLRGSASIQTLELKAERILTDEQRLDCRYQPRPAESYWQYYYVYRNPKKIEQLPKKTAHYYLLRNNNRYNIGMATTDPQMSHEDFVRILVSDKTAADHVKAATKDFDWTCHLYELLLDNVSVWTKGVLSVD